MVFTVVVLSCSTSEDAQFTEIDSGPLWVRLIGTWLEGTREEEEAGVFSLYDDGTLEGFGGILNVYE